jgi:hypothetical protein
MLTCNTFIVSATPGRSPLAREKVFAVRRFVPFVTLSYMGAAICPGPATGGPAPPSVASFGAIAESHEVVRLRKPFTPIPRGHPPDHSTIPSDSSSHPKGESFPSGSADELFKRPERERHDFTQFDLDEVLRVFRSNIFGKEYRKPRQIGEYRYLPLKKLSAYAALANATSCIVYRSAPEGHPFGPPLYYLFTGTDVLTFHGNGQLPNLAAKARNAWLSQESAGSRPSIALIGDGTLQDFDAARLTIEMATSEKRSISLQGDPSAVFSFAAPQWLRIELLMIKDRPYEPISWAAVTVAYRNDVYRAEVAYKGRVARLYARTIDVLVELIAVLREFLLEYEHQSGPLSLEAIEAFQARSRARLEALYERRPDLRKEETSTPSADLEEGFSQRRNVKFSRGPFPFRYAEISTHGK